MTTGLLKAFAEDRDIHQSTAAEVFDVALENVDADQRRSAKAINFGLIYGMSAFGLARQLGINRAKAQEYVDMYFARYPGVKTYMDATREHAREAGFVETVFGRRLYLPEIHARQAQRRQYAERSAINAPMQGSAADIIKKSMIAVDSWLQASKVDARLIMQVHDELVLEVHRDSARIVQDQVVALMNTAADLRVPLKGRRWRRQQLGRGPLITLFMPVLRNFSGWLASNFLGAKDTLPHNLPTRESIDYPKSVGLHLGCFSVTAHPRFLLVALLLTP